MKLIYNIMAILVGLSTVLKHAFRKNVTREYPKVKQNLPDKFRGKPMWTPEKCVACRACEKVCPAYAIEINKVADDNINFKLDLNKCIFCGNCSYNCPKQAIEMSDDYELASDKKSSLYIEINTLNSNL